MRNAQVWWRILPLGMAAVLMGATPLLAAKRPRPVACPGGRFPVAGDPLVPGSMGADAVAIDGTSVTIDSGCTTVAKRKVTRRLTRLVARWATCGSLTGARLVIKLDASTCETLTGRFRVRAPRMRRDLSAQVEVPAGAAGRVRDGLPPGAVQVSQAEWDELTQRPDVHPFGPGQTAEDGAAQAVREAADEELVAAFLLNNPLFTNQYRGGVDPANPSVGDADQGNFAFTTMDTTGAPQTVITHGKRWFTETVAGGLRRFPTQTNQLNLYDDYYGGLFAIDPALVGQLPTPATVRGFGLGDLLALNDSLGNQVGQYLQLVPPPGGTPPPGYPVNCAAEEGAGDGTDRYGEVGCGTHTTSGVYKNKTWPLKFLATCVKNQASRGTCWSFATNGAIELTVAKKYGRWINLAEQDLIYNHHALWFPHAYGDGGWPGNALTKAAANDYFHPFEAQWDYNPSGSRTADDMTATYRNSCVGYGGDESAFCSDTAGQGQVACFPLWLFYFCLAVPPNYGGASSGFHATAFSELWDGASPSNSFGKILWAVAIFRKPVIYSFAVAPSFYPDANGYVKYNGPHCPVTVRDGRYVCTPGPGCECDVGGHAVLVTGLIDNSQLPAGAPPGSGGGYLIIKNSWSHCYGDAGYAYLPYDWVKAYGLSAVVLGDVN